MKKKLLMSITVITMMLVLVVAGTMAWFTDAEEVENVFHTGTVDIEIGEVETDPIMVSNWNPGDERCMKYTFTNNGTKNLCFRIGFEGEWEDALSTDNIALLGKDGEQWIPFYGWLNFDDEIVLQRGMRSNTFDYNDDWHFRDGYLYYGGIEGWCPADCKLAPGESVELLLCTKLDGPMTGNDYQDKDFTLKAKVQAVQSSHADEWDWDNLDFETGLELH